MSDAKVRLILDAVDKTGPALKTATTELAKMKAAASSLIGTFTSLKAAIISASVTMGFSAMIKQAVDYNSTLETTRLGISAILTSMTEMRDAQGRLIEGQDKFAAAGQMAIKAQEELRRIGMTTAATYTELVEVYQGILAPALSAKMTFEETLEITGLLTNAVKAIGLPIQQIKQEARDLIQGGIQPASSSLATALGISDAMVKKWREQGTLFKESKSRLEGFVYASKEFENSWGGVWSNFKDVIQKTIGEGMNSVFASLKAVISEITKSLVNIQRDGNGVITSITVKPEVLEKFRMIGTHLAHALRIAKELGGLIATIATKIPGVASSARAIANQEAWNEIRRYEGLGGIPLSSSPPVGLELLTKKYSTDQIAKALAAGRIRIVPGEAKKGVFAATETFSYGEDLDAFFAELEKRQAVTMKAKPGATREDVLNKTVQLQQAIYKLIGLERELIEVQAKEYEKEGIDAKLVAQWKEISLQKIAIEEAERYRTLMEKGQAQDAERTLERIQFLEQLIQAENELIDAEERLAVARGTISQEQAINSQYDRRIEAMEKQKNLLIELLNSLTAENAENEKAREISKQLLAIQLRINKAIGDRTNALKENTEELRRQAYSEMGFSAAGYGAFREEELQRKAQAWRDAGMAEVDIERKIASERKAIATEANRYILENATSFGEAWVALMQQKGLEAGNVFVQMAREVEAVFEEIGSVINEVLGDTITGKLKSLEDYCRRLLASLTQMIMKWMQQEFMQMMSGGSGGGLGAFLGKMFGFSGGGVSSDIMALGADEAAAWGYHTGGWVPRMHFGGLQPDEYPAILQRGEYVVSKKGVSFLDKINKGEFTGFGGNVVNNITNNISAIDGPSVAQFFFKNRRLAATAMGMAAAERHPIRRK